MGQTRATFAAARVEATARSSTTIAMVTAIHARNRLLSLSSAPETRFLAWSVSSSSRSVVRRLVHAVNDPRLYARSLHTDPLWGRCRAGPRAARSERPGPGRADRRRMPRRRRVRGERMSKAREYVNALPKTSTVTPMRRSDRDGGASVQPMHNARLLDERRACKSAILRVRAVSSVGRAAAF